eukprot:UN34442
MAELSTEFLIGGNYEFNEKHHMNYYVSSMPNNRWHVIREQCELPDGLENVVFMPEETKKLLRKAVKD